MAVKTSRPSSLTTRKLFNSQLQKGNIPTSIWPQKRTPKNPNPNSDYPILTALENFIHSPPHLSQILTQLLTSGQHHSPFIAGHFIKHLSPHSAVSLYSLLPDRDAFISNTILRSFLSLSQPLKALSFFRDFVVPSFIPPNNFTFPLVAKIFSCFGLVRNGETAHAQIVRLGFEDDLYVRNSIIHMYSCFGDVSSAWKLFEGFVEGSSADLITWNSMIDGCVKNGMVEAARELFDEMRDRDLVSWNIMIAGYAGSGSVEEARKLFDEMPKRDVVTWNSMIDGYAKTGDVVLARELFDLMPKKNLISWNAMLAMYTRVKDWRECLKFFDAMMSVGTLRPNGATFVSVLTACAKLGDLGRGKWVHSLIENTKEPSDLLLSTALLTMYAKCGAMDNAKEVFDGMVERSVVTWNSMIIGYALNGLSQKALEQYLEMERNGVRPNEKTFVCVLTACAHGGLVVEGLWCFNRMVRTYRLEPKVEHIGCMVNLLGRAGLLKECGDIVKRAEVEPSKALWGALMSSSRAHCDWELGKIIGKKMIEMEPKETGPYVLLSNIYAAEGRWGDVEKVRVMMHENGLKKDGGVSLVGGEEFEFELLGGKQESVVSKKRMVYTMLTEMGNHVKLSCRSL